MERVVGWIWNELIGEQHRDVSIGDATDEAPLPAIGDAEAEVIVVYRHPAGFEIAKSETWKDLEQRQFVWPIDLPTAM